MIMKRQLMGFISLFFGIALMAAPVSQEAARQKALQFLSGRSGNVAAARGMNQVKLQLKEGVVTDQLYVFNVGQKDGFVIVSGDDCTGDLVLGYADKGEISAGNMPDNLRSWLQGYADQIQWMKEHGVRNDAAASRGAMKKSKAAILAMLTTKWNQGDPYNANCPTVEYDNHSYSKAATGCVATATAQIMFYQAKKKGIDQTTTSKTIPAYFSDGTYWFFGQSGSNQMPAKPVATIDWTKIDAGLTTSDARTEVAKLMEYVGAAVEMQYGPESGASNDKVAWALSEYFRYDPDARTIYQEDYTYENWVDAIYDELYNNGPVLFGGQSSTGGHAFVIEGYDHDDYFYVNWGWGGLSDGSFRLSVLSPQNQGIGGSEGGYNFNQTAMVNVNPLVDNTNDLQAEARLMVNLCNSPAVSATKNGDNFFVKHEYTNYPIPFNYSLVNKSGWELSFDWALALYQGNTLKKLINENVGRSFPNRGTSYGYFTQGLDGSGLSDGEYRLVYVSRKNGTSTWYECEGSEQNYIRVVVSGNTMTLTNMPANIKVTSGDGSVSSMAANSSLVTPNDALALDLTGVSGVTSVTPNNNPNTLYIVGTTTPSGLENSNVVKNSIAETLDLKDGYAFYSPYFFYAKTATYTRQFSVGADGTKGWNTIVVPFNVSTVRQGSKTIDWFHSSSDTDKQFWLKSFSGDGANTVNFSYADQLSANTPYIIAVPGNKWGTAYDLTNKDIVFEGSGNITIAPSFMNISQYGSYYIFKGTTVNDAVTNCYVLNNDGTKFSKSTTSMEPFRAYFVSRMATAYGDFLAIGSENGDVTAIGAPSTKSEEAIESNKLYNMKGQRVSQPTKGLYIVGGKKVIVK